ncbi:MAG TPA: peptidoglycan DD-metalloendopeptidase family protein [Candidatus Limnocylindrales bacterium]
MTASNDRRTASRKKLAGRLIRLFLGVALLTPALAFQTPPIPVKADALSDAVAEQKRLVKIIADQKAQLAKLNSQQAALKSQIAATSQNLTDVRTSITQSESDIAALSSEMVGVKAHYDNFAAEQSLLEARLAELSNEQEAKQRELDVREQILAARLVAAYETDQTSVMQQLLTAHSLTEALSDASYYGALSQADKALADQIRSDQQSLAEIKQTVELASTANQQLKDAVAAQQQSLADDQAHLTAAEKQLADLKASLEKQLAGQNAAEAKLDSNKAALDAAIQSNGLAMDDLGSKIDQLVAQMAPTAKIPSRYSGTFQWPMGGQITQDFGCTGVASEPRVGNCAHFHQGVDIAAPCLTPIYASGPGVVVFVGYNPYDAAPKAWLVIVAHSTSIVTWYAHMTAHAPAGIYVGAQVTSKTVVGTENTTGHSTGCHLHWAVRVNGVFVNPRLFI